MKHYDHYVMIVPALRLIQQVDEGDQEIISIRETSALGPLLYGLIGLGIATLVATALFWWFTRPAKQPHLTPPSISGGTDG